jgi:ATP synthase protein I
MVTELVVGMLMGLGIGYGLDHLFGTMPLFLIIFTILGFAAGVRTMMRSAEEVQMKDTIVDSDDLSIKNKDDNDD